MHRDDRGVVLPLVALCMIALLVMVAMVLDLGSTRTVRRESRSAADSGSTAGAMALAGASTTLAACQDAFAYTFQNLGGPQPTASAITTACAPLNGVCVEGSGRSASLVVGERTVSVTNPVVDSSPLMRAVAVGGGQSQPIDALDGTGCQRVGVGVTQPQSRFFGGVAGGSGATFAIHSVARSAPPGRSGDVVPALVALHPTMRCSIDAGSGVMVFKAGGTIGGLAYSDSDGSTDPFGCGDSFVLNLKSSAKLLAESAGTTPGELGWFSVSAPPGYDTTATVSQLGTEAASNKGITGTLVSRTTRTTRRPVDRTFNCSGLSPAEPGCAGTDFVADSENLAKVTALRPGGYMLYPNPLAVPLQTCDTTAAPVVLTAGDWWVDCPAGFTVKGNPLTIQGGGTVVFRGRLAVESGGSLNVNVATTPSIDGLGYPVPSVGSRQTTLIIASTASDSFSLSSSSSAAYLAQTAIYSKGGGVISGSPTLRWNAPAGGPAKALIWWSESTQPWLLSGGPTLAARGIMFHGNGPVTISGGGLIDLTKVQVWARSANISGGGTLRLAPDPDYSIKTQGAGTALVR